MLLAGHDCFKNVNAVHALEAPYCRSSKACDMTSACVTAQAMPYKCLHRHCSNADANQIWNTESALCCISKSVCICIMGSETLSTCSASEILLDVLQVKATGP